MELSDYQILIIEWLRCLTGDEWTVHQMNSEAGLSYNPDTRNSHETRLSSYGDFVECKLWHQRADKDMHTCEFEVSSSTEY